jgi:hypothetical protein
VADKPPLRQEDVERVIRLLGPLISERLIVLVGGQAVAFWMRFLAPRSEVLAAAEWLTSKDIDFAGSARSVARAAELLEGRAKLATIDDNTPNTGLVQFSDAAGIQREIDFIDEPLGLRGRDVRETAVQLEIPAESGGDLLLWIMHPERCMESRVVNTAPPLRKDDELAIRQLETSVICARLWSGFLLDSDEFPEEERVRAVLNLNERIFRRCMHDRRFRDVLGHGVDPFEAVLLDPRLPERFRETRYRQMQVMLAERREKDRRNRARVAARARRRGPSPG